MTERSTDKRPTPDQAEDNAFFPSPYSLGQFTSSKSDLGDADYPNAYREGRWKVLMIATDERYLLMQNGTMFSTGNHPVEMLLPMYHIDKAGFDVDIATLSGNPVKLELWALPKEDEAVQSVYRKYLDKLKRPLKLSDVIEKNLGDNSDYIAVFIPGGHGALIGIPQSLDVKTVLRWAMNKDKHIISLCHGPAALLAAGIGEAKEDYIFKGYKICVFPDDIDRKTPDIGYMPGAMPWFIGEKLRELGVEILNSDITGETHQDRKLITGDSPFASNNVGKAAARALLGEVGTN
ncbi:glyoxalase III HchA [Reyranella sp. CPCC 100927]|uniref:glyoxalase III HchA n=1 Tax=Reyranella sp. CPCC 100927 TaxID=2599616 RepID=UPI0011B69BDF|nr:glyoxalase III HchA [Reyranella sp. CPCC 100927]TWT10702.1 protein deglycase HchA [Reyranella sp. CPCC 100927]